LGERVPGKGVSHGNATFHPCGAKIGGVFGRWGKKGKIRRGKGRGDLPPRFHSKKKRTKGKDMKNARKMKMW